MNNTEFNKTIDSLAVKIVKIKNEIVVSTEEADGFEYAYYIYVDDLIYSRRGYSKRKEARLKITDVNLYHELRAKVFYRCKGFKKSKSTIALTTVVSTKAKEIERKNTEALLDNKIAQSDYISFVEFLNLQHDVSIVDFDRYLKNIFERNDLILFSKIIKSYKFGNKSPAIFVLLAIVARMERNYFFEREALENFFSFPLQTSLRAKKLKIRYVDLLSNFYKDFDSAFSFVNRCVAYFNNDEWYQMLYQYLKDRMDGFRNTKLDDIQDLFPSTGLKTEGEAALSQLNQKLSRIVNRASEDRLVASDLYGVHELFKLRHKILYSAGSYSSTEILIEKCFSKLMHKIKDFNYSIELAYFEDMYPYVSEAESYLRNIDFDYRLLNSTGWAILSDLFVAFGFFKLSYLFREKYLDSLLFESDGNYNRFNLQKVVIGLLERGHVENAIDIFHSNKNKLSRDGFCSLNNAIAIYTSNIEDLIQPSDSQFSMFRELVSGRSVAIVGPSFGSTSKGQLIDSYDIVARNNVISFESIDNLSHGSKTDISYYGTGTLTKHSAELRDLSNTLKCMVFKVDAQNFGGSCLQRIRCKPPFFKGTPNQLPIMMYDLLLAKPDELKVFNMDFHCSEHPYHPSYQHTTFNHRAYVCHDPVGSLALCRAITSSSQNVEVDQECERVLSMTNSEYMSKMERLHPFSRVTVVCN